MLVFVPDADVDAVRAVIDAGLPGAFRGRPVRYGWDAVPVGHHVEVGTPADWLHRHLGFELREPTPRDCDRFTDSTDALSSAVARRLGAVHTG